MGELSDNMLAVLAVLTALDNFSENVRVLRPPTRPPSGGLGPTTQSSIFLACNLTPP